VNVLLFGATGSIGRRIAAEALRRGHRVTGVTRARDVAGAPPAGMRLVAGDAGDSAQVAVLAAGQDVVASAVAPPRDGSEPTGPFLAVNRALVEGLRRTAVRRLVVVGGAGTLEVAPGLAIMDSPGFPDAPKPEAGAHRSVLEFYRTVQDLNWTYLSPAAEFGPGERTGTFRIDGDQLLKGADGRSRISAEDYAIAFLDEIEHPKHIKQRFCVAY
jgi:uncharacterized protein